MADFEYVAISARELVRQVQQIIPIVGVHSLYAPSQGRSQVDRVRDESTCRGGVVTGINGSG
jgi:hypothetical protein